MIISQLDGLLGHKYVSGYEVNKPSKILIKTLNASKYIQFNIQSLRHQEHMILISIMYEKTYLHGSLERVLEAIQVSSL